MSGSPQLANAENWEKQFLQICEDFRISTLGLTGLEYVMEIEKFEAKHIGHPRLGPFVSNHAQGMRNAALKGSSSIMIVNQGNSSNFQSGSDLNSEIVTAPEG
jgi:hypothetical protein